MVKLTAQETGPSLRDVAVLAMARLEAAPDLLGGWSDVEAQSLRQAASRVLDGQIDAARVMSAAAARLVSGIDLVPFLEPDGPFGPAWPAHPLASSAFNVGYRLREPDITRELAALMGPRAGRQGNERALSFLRILTDLAGAHEVGASGIPSFHETATSRWIALDRCITSAKRCMRGRSRTSGMLGMSS